MTVAEVASTVDAVLVVDNDVNLIKSFELVGRSGGVAIVGVSSGKAALAKLAQREWALLLVDVAMPEMGGREFLARARKAGLLKKVRAVRVLTAKGRGNEDAQKLAAEGYKVVEKGEFDARSIQVLLRDPEAGVGPNRGGRGGLEERLRADFLRQELAQAETSLSELESRSTAAEGRDIGVVIEKLKEAFVEANPAPTPKTPLREPIGNMTLWTLATLLLTIGVIGWIGGYRPTVTWAIYVTSLVTLICMVLLERAEQTGDWIKSLAFYVAAAGLLFEAFMVVTALFKGAHE